MSTSVEDVPSVAGHARGAARGPPIADMLAPRPGLRGFFNVSDKVLSAVRGGAVAVGECAVWTGASKTVTVEGTSVHIRRLVYNVCVAPDDGACNYAATCGSAGFCIRPSHLQPVPKSLKRKSIHPGDFFVSPTRPVASTDRRAPARRAKRNKTANHAKSA